MKKVLFLAFILPLLSCEKDKDSEKAPTTYQIINNIERFDYDEYLNGTLWEIVVFGYGGDDIIRQDNISTPVLPDGGLSEKKEITSDITKIKVSFKLLPKESPFYDLPENNRKYVVAFKNIVKETNNVVVIDGKTMLSGSLKADTSDESFIYLSDMGKQNRKE